MVIIASLLAIMLAASAMVLSACMLAGQQSRQLEQADGTTVELSGRWSGTSFGGKYVTKLPVCSFEPEDLEDVQAVHHF